MNETSQRVQVALPAEAFASLRWLLLLLVSNNVSPEEKIVACIECLPQLQAVLDTLPEPDKDTWLPPKRWRPEKKTHTEDP